MQTERVQMRVLPELKNRLVAESEARGMPLTEVVVTLVCQALGTPELAVMPRGRPGRKPRRSRHRVPASKPTASAPTSAPPASESGG